jgi:hypothetical protein
VFAKHLFFQLFALGLSSVAHVPILGVQWHAGSNTAHFDHRQIVEGWKIWQHRGLALAHIWTTYSNSFVHARLVLAQLSGHTTS